MTTYFEDLLSKLENTTAKELVQALYVLRAPNNLVAIIPVCRAFKEMHISFPALCEAPVFGLDKESYEQGLELLDRIAALDVDDDHFSGRCLQNRKNQWTPMRPRTGDSVIAELLLVTALEQNNQENFKAVAAWLIRQVQYFHAQRVSLGAYEHYLLSKDARLVESHHASRPYNSLLELQKLAGHSEKLQLFAATLNTYDEESSFKLALLASLNDAASTTERGRLEQYISQTLSVEAKTLTSHAADIATLLPRSWQLLLFSIWESRLSIITKPGGGGGSASPRRVDRNEIIFGTTLTEIFAHVGDEEDASHSGIVADFFERGAAIEDPDSDDPDEEEQREPVFSLFLSDRNDLLSSFYASKSIQSSIELHNAQLCWTRYLLSTEALSAVVNLITNFKHDIDYSEVLARLSIGLSLITGRTIGEVATPIISTQMNELPTRDTPVIIDKAKGKLLLFAAQPKLAEKHQNPPFCFPHQSHVALNLPVSWQPLISLLEEGQNKRRANVTRICASLLSKLPSHLRVTPKSLRNTFIQKLLQVTSGDLGVQKVITDGAEANIENIIHYASYFREDVEIAWRKTVEALLKESLPQQIEPVSHYGYVGTPHSFDISQLKNVFIALQQDIVEAAASHDLPKALHGFSLYMALRLGLATAGRSTKLPLPRIYVSQGWALVADKSRIDGSTDRILPLTFSLMKQIAIYIDVVQGLSPLQPELTPLQRDERGLYLQLVCLDEDNNLVPYQPKHLREYECLEGLPPNWGRKVVRSVSPQLLGRYKDVGLGHWVRGRHPWDITSTLNADSFTSAWIATQQQLEHQLGFKEIRFPELQLSHQRIARSYPETIKKPRANATKQVYEADEIRMRLQISAPHYLNALESPKTKEKPGIALEMIRLMLRRNASELSVEQLAPLAEAACLYVRENYQIPLFANRPRAIFASQHLLNFTSLQALAYFEEHYAKAFHNDLAVLPKNDWSNETKAEMAQIELGRLVMIGIWRLGLNRWPLLEGWLRYIWQGKSILAAKELRYMCFRVKAENRQDTMRRTVLLDDFTVAYLVSERNDLVAHVLPPLFDKNYMTTGRLRKIVDSAVGAYLKQLVSVKPLTLSHLMAANTQRIMLSAAPILAAYSRGAFLTEDLDDDVMRRLQGLQPTRQNADITTHPRHQETVLGDAGVPADVIAASNFVKKLNEIDTNSTLAWYESLREIVPITPLERLVHAFSVWLAEKAKKEADIFSNRAKGTFVNRLKVVAHVLLGEYPALENTITIDETLFAEWYELGRTHFRERTNQGAWFQFYHFLKQYPLKEIGWRVGDLGQEPEQQVSARVFSASEIGEAKRRVLSPRSGIANKGNRQTAKRVLDLIATYGVRRGEAVALRKVDYQRNVLRVQPYGEHQLKTASADRVLPLSIASSDMFEWLNKTIGLNTTYLLANESSGEVSEENFFHALNIMLKEVCQDANMGMHHFRHTVASRWVVSLLKNAIGLTYLEKDLPWLAEWEISDNDLNKFLNNEVDGGQGLRVLSAMLGHLHPTTTLRHYVHSLCICLHGSLNKIDTLSITRSFERRVASRATMKRWAKDARESAAHIDDTKLRQQAENRVIRDHIERRFKQKGIHVDERRLDAFSRSVSIDGNTHGKKENAKELNFLFIESLDYSLRHGASLVDKNTLKQAAEKLQALAKIPSGKKGSATMRHPLEPNEKGILLPKPLAAGSAQKAANNLCLWLAALQEKDEKNFFWLLEKWTHASERERGRMLLQGKKEKDIAEKLDGQGLVEIQTETLSQANEAWRMRIKCLDDKGKLVIRDTVAVRWVMSYVVALFDG